MLEIARVEYLAFEHDPQLSCAFPDRSSPSALSDRASTLSEQFTIPSSRVMKVIDSENNICAAAVWEPHLEDGWETEKSKLSSREIYGPSANIPLCENFFGRFDGILRSLMQGEPCASEYLQPASHCLLEKQEAAASRKWRDDCLITSL